jgi:hypothetical protein
MVKKSDRFQPEISNLLENLFEIKDTQEKVVVCSNCTRAHAFKIARLLNSSEKRKTDKRVE